MNLYYKSLQEQFLSSNKENSETDKQSVEQQTSEQMNELSSTVSKGEGESCEVLANKLTDPSLIKDATQSILPAIQELLKDDIGDCYIKTLNKLKPNLIKKINNMETELNNKKKTFNSRLIGLDVREEFYKYLISKKERVENEIKKNKEGGGGGDSSKILSFDEKNDINKRLSMYYNKKSDYIKYYYNILYYIYILLFLLYLFFLMWNIYLLYTAEGDKDKIRFLLIGVILISFTPLLIKYIINYFLQF